MNVASLTGPEAHYGNRYHTHMEEGIMHIFYALGPQVWGRGLTKQDAVRNMKQTSSKVEEYTIYRTNDCEAYVDDMGSLKFRKGFYLEIIERYPKSRQVEYTQNNDDLKQLRVVQQDRVWFLDDQVKKLRTELRQQKQVQKALETLKPGDICLLDGYMKTGPNTMLIQVVGVRGCEPWCYSKPGRADLIFKVLASDMGWLNDEQEKFIRPDEITKLEIVPDDELPLQIGRFQFTTPEFEKVLKERAGS